MFSVPTAVMLDLLLGLVFACASLWMGVKHLTLNQVVWVLVGHSVDGRIWELGPYFWAMHTVFLPLLFYLAVVFLCWLGKAAVAYRGKFYGRAAQPGINGLNMTAGFLTFIATILGAVATLLRVFAGV